MLRKLILAVGLLCAAWLPANAQSSNANVVASCGSVTYDQLLSRPLTQDPTGKLCVNATVNATVGGFQPNGAYGTLTATAASSASTALPTGATVRITNLGASAIISCTFATGAATGLVSNLTIPPLSSVSRVVGSFDHIACIDQTGSTGSNLVVLEGGSGLGNDSGGGGGSGGGATNVTQVGGTNVNATVAAAGALPIDVIPGNNLATLIAASVPAGTARIGYVSDDPCNSKIKLNAPFSTTSGGPVSLIALSGSTVIYVCSISAITDAAIKLSFIDGTGGSCAAAQHAIWGSTTAASGMSLAANGGFTQGSGNGSVGVTTAASALCLLQSGTSLIAGNVTYVQQ